MQAVAGDGQSLYAQRLVEDKKNVLDRIDEVGADQATIFALEQALEPAMSKAGPGSALNDSPCENSGRGPVPAALRSFDKRA